MPVYTQSKRHQELAKLFKQCAAPRTAPQQEQTETQEQKAKRQAYEAKKAASNAAIMASLRAANPKQEIATGSPYQAAREAWINPSSSTPLDHWTSQKD
jgi:cell division septation protein DedD